MNKDDYLKEIAKLLWKLPKRERDDVISDYHEHFIIGIEKGRSEEEIAKALGNPKNVAKQINAEYMVKKAEDKQSAGSMFEAILAAAGLGIFNLIFVAVPALIVFALVLTSFAVGLVMIFGGILITISYMFQSFIPIINLDLPLGGILGILAGILIGVCLTILGLGLIAATAYITKWLYGLAIRYLKYNMRIIEGRKGPKKSKGVS
jgi:uncharacterized membrane protein